MSKYYNPQRTRNIYDPQSTEPFRISRSKIDLYINCPRCFYLDRRLGVGQPPGYPFSLNSAVDNLLKNEFDAYRERQETHPLMKENGIDAVPYKHEKIEEWRDALRRGCTYQFPGTNLLITGAVDDIWVTPDEQLIIVDYKATAKDGVVTLDEDWQDGYKRQMEIYQWLFRKNGFKVYPTGYFLYCNGDGDKDKFDGKLVFEISLIPYKGADAWVDKTISEIYSCLQNDTLPDEGEDCDFCKYRQAVNNSIKQIEDK